MKKSLIVILALLMCLSGCGNSERYNQKATTESNQTNHETESDEPAVLVQPEKIYTTERYYEVIKKYSPRFDMLKPIEVFDALGDFQYCTVNGYWTYEYKYINESGEEFDIQVSPFEDDSPPSMVRQEYIEHMSDPSEGPYNHGFQIYDHFEQPEKGVDDIYIYGGVNSKGVPDKYRYAVLFINKKYFKNNSMIFTEAIDLSKYTDQKLDSISLIYVDGNLCYRYDTRPTNPIVPGLHSIQYYDKDTGISYYLYCWQKDNYGAFDRCNELVRSFVKVDTYKEAIEELMNPENAQ